MVEVMGTPPESRGERVSESTKLRALKAELSRGMYERVTDILRSIKLVVAVRRNVRESEHFAASEHKLRLALSIGRIPERLTIMGVSPL